MEDEAVGSKHFESLFNLPIKKVYWLKTHLRNRQERRRW